MADVANADYTTSSCTTKLSSGSSPEAKRAKAIPVDEKKENQKMIEKDSTTGGDNVAAAATDPAALSTSAAAASAAAAANTNTITAAKETPRKGYECKLLLL